jgi:hypothetical protein
MKALALLAATLIRFSSVAAATTTVPDPVLPDIFQVTYNIFIPSGISANLATPVAAMPGDKRLVIRTVSYTAAGLSKGASMAVTIGTEFDCNGRNPYLPLQVQSADQSPATTLSTTFYAGGGTPIVRRQRFTCDLECDDQQLLRREDIRDAMIHRGCAW